ncbi:hypothetical protein ACJ6WF_04560 [Streptomyces sp. MMS24-I2-30]|uniref:hypothetical protein n=1 Tax=Streptomyces sp. MMS24-I2-30 TaxID=3351564 RepID=UPI003896B958
MTFTYRSRTLRTMATGALTVALVSAGSTAAQAATPSPGADLTRATAAQRTSLTAEVSPASVKPGEEVRITGRTTGLKVGAEVTLQQDKNGKWTTVPGRSTVKQGDMYSVSTRPTAKGTQHYRVASGGTHSPSVTVTVK